MNAIKPDCARAVTPINDIIKSKIGNMWNFRLIQKNSKISIIVENLDIKNNNDT